MAFTPPSRPPTKAEKKQYSLPKGHSDRPSNYPRGSSQPHHSCAPPPAPSRDFWFYFPYTLSESSKRPRDNQPPNAPPKLDLRHSLPTNTKEIWRHRPIVFLGMADVEPWASFFEYHMPEKTYVNNRFTHVEQILKFYNNFVVHMTPMAVYLYISPLYWIGPLADAGYHVLKHIDHSHLLAFLVQMIGCHNNLMRVREDDKLPTWSLKILLADTPHLQRLSHYHAYINVLFKSQFPDYRKTRNLRGNFFQSGRIIH